MCVCQWLCIFCLSSAVQSVSVRPGQIVCLCGNSYGGPCNRVLTFFLSQRGRPLSVADRILPLTLSSCCQSHHIVTWSPPESPPLVCLRQEKCTGASVWQRVPLRLCPCPSNLLSCTKKTPQILQAEYTVHYFSRNSFVRFPALQIACSIDKLLLNSCQSIINVQLWARKWCACVICGCVSFGTF